MDESFKRPGSIPFKWEIEPGVPKIKRRAGRTTLGELLVKLKPPPSMVTRPPSPKVYRSLSISSFTRHIHRHVKSTTSFQQCFPVLSLGHRKGDTYRSLCNAFQDIIAGKSMSTPECKSDCIANSLKCKYT